jgi:hypothetical protein
VRLAFTVATDRQHIRGTESLAFTPDRPVHEIVLRLWPNSPGPRAAGGSMTVTQTSADELASTGLDGSKTLLRLNLRHLSPAGQTLHAQLAFTLTLPIRSSDRYGFAGNVDWWASAFPLLSYVRGEGYATEPPTRLFAEATTSEEFRLADLAVTAPAGDTVLANGTPRSRHGNTWNFTATSIRDVAVATGRFRSAHTSADGVPITVGVTDGLPDNPTAIASRIAGAVRDHARRLGPFPFAQLNVPVVPYLHGGIEYPGEIYLGTNQLDATPSHEVAHEWFYGLVGDDQARDPWLDEAFATYVEALQDGEAAYYASTTVPAAGRDRVGAPMTYWARFGETTYYRSVYLQGATALWRARQAAGPRAFDRALRCYVNAEAHRVARPADLARALHGLPAALRVLRAAGALD